MSKESTSNKKPVSSHYDSVTKETTITYSDGSTTKIMNTGKSLSGAVTATSSSTSRKMKREGSETEENTENKS